MLLAIAALLIQVPAVPQNAIPITTTAAADRGSSVAFTPDRIVPEPASSATGPPTSWQLPLFASTAFVPPLYLAMRTSLRIAPSKKLPCIPSPTTF